MSIQLDISRPNTPADQCVKCTQQHQTGQHRVIHNQSVSMFANATPLLDQTYGTEEIRLRNGWFYLSLHTPVRPVLDILRQGRLPWVCPQCAGYPGKSNLDAPGATVLTATGEQRATGVHTLFDKQRHEREAVI